MTSLSTRHDWQVWGLRQKSGFSLRRGMNAISYHWGKLRLRHHWNGKRFHIQQITTLSYALRLAYIQCMQCNAPAYFFDTTYATDARKLWKQVCNCQNARTEALSCCIEFLALCPVVNIKGHQMSDSKAKMHQNYISTVVSAPDTNGGAFSAPRAPALFKGDNF